MEYICEHRRYAVPFRAPIRTAHGQWSVREGVIVRITGSDGTCGWGEVAPVPAFGTETISEAVAGLAKLGPKIDAAAWANLPVRLRCTRGALRTAWSEANANGAGGRAGAAIAPRGPEHWPVAALLPAGREAITALRARTELGFRVCKWKVGICPPAEELPLLDDVLAELPPGAKLRLDANGAWDRRQAESWLERCADRPIEFLEQPIAAETRGAEDLLSGLAADYPTPLALDESLGGDDDVVRWLGRGWRGIWVVKPSLLADAPATLARLAQAKAPVVFSSALETRVGLRAALALLWNWEGEIRALGFGVWPLFSDRRFDGGEPAPWIHRADWPRLDPEVVWNALT